MKAFLSHGGHGDSWIVYLKLLPYSNEPITWIHTTAHEMHVGPIQEIQSLMPNCSYQCIQGNKKLSVAVIDKFKNDFPDGIEINTKAGELQNPTPDLSFLKLPKYKESYIVVQPVAGRPIDTTLRIIEQKAIQQLRDFISPKHPIMLLGHECSYDIPNVLDLSGKTTVAEAISHVGQSSLFIGYHGFLAYVAMSFKIPTIMIFDVPWLPNHYTNPVWQKNTMILWAMKSYNAPTIISDASPITKCLGKYK